MTHNRVPVELGERSYDIVIGQNLLGQATTLIKPLLNAGRVAVITDETVNDLHGDTLREGLAGLDQTWIIRPAGEAQKSFEGLQAVLNGLFEAGFDRHDTIIAFGGGVIGDLTGFAASIYKRGCHFIQIPTTLLAQVDSSVGGKTGINNHFGKNLIGAFYQPKLVLADMDVLQTLPERELKAGYAEVLKYGLLGDRLFFSWLEDNGHKVLEGNPEALAEAVAVSCRTKARIVAEDEFENGKRALLNLGHSFAHALEIEAGYDGNLLHGEAVSAGMEMAFEISTALDLNPPEDLERVKAHIETQRLTGIDDVKRLLADPQKLLDHMKQDKKNSDGRINLILVQAIGEAFIHKDADKEALLSYLSALSKRAA